MLSRLLGREDDQELTEGAVGQDTFGISNLLIEIHWEHLLFFLGEYDLSSLSQKSFLLNKSLVICCEEN